MEHLSSQDDLTFSAVNAHTSMAWHNKTHFLLTSPGEEAWDCQGGIGGCDCVKSLIPLMDLLMRAQVPGGASKPQGGRSEGQESMESGKRYALGT